MADTDRRLQMLAAVARRTGNAVIVTGVDGCIEWVNEGFTRLTGYTPEEVQGRRPGSVLQGPETSAESRAAMAEAIRNRQPFEQVVLNYARSGRQYWVRVEAEPTFDEQGRFNGYIALETDDTERRIAEGREAVTKRVGDRLLSCDDIESAARIVADELVHTLDVRAAQVWTVVPGMIHLRYEAGAVGIPEAQAWVDATRGNTFQRGTEWVVGVGAPGAAWGTGGLCVKTDFWQKDNNGQFSRRAVAARAAGIRTVCAVPVHGTDGVVAIIEIGGSHTYPGHERLPSLVERIAQQLGAFILREQSRRAFEALFRHSPDAVLVVDGAGIVSRSNARAAGLFGDVEGRPLGTLLDGAAALLSLDPAPAHEPASSEVDAAVELHTCTAYGRNGPFPAEVSLSTTRATGAPSQIVAIRDLTERVRAEEQLRRSLEEKVTLVQEVHHRVKNNLQIISSLVSLQSDGIADPAIKSVLLDTVQRIHSMALVHQQLYASDNLARIDFGEYAVSLCNMLHGMVAPQARVQFDIERVEIPVERAAPCGLILNELVTNAFKYGISRDGSCTLTVRVRTTPQGFALSVEDEGPGHAPNATRAGSMGQTLVAALVRQLRATRSVTPLHPERAPGQDPGSRVHIAVPLPAGR